MRVSRDVERNPSDVSGETRIVSKLNASQGLRVRCPFCPAWCDIVTKCCARQELSNLKACCVLSFTVSNSW